MNFWQRLFGRKASEGRQVLVMNQVGTPQSSPKNYEAFSKEAFQANVIAFQAITKVSRACSGIKWTLYSKRKGGEPTEITEHPLLNLMQQPNPSQGQSSFMGSVVGYLMISGNSYIEKVSPTDKAPPMELWSLRPDKMRIIPGAIGMPSGYEFKGQSTQVIFPVDQVSGKSKILHLKTFHPTDNWYGMSAIEAAMYAVDQHNEAGKWNLSLLQNMGTPSGALVVKQDASNPMGSLPDTQFRNLQEEIRSQIQGSKNAGRVMLLEGGMDWKQMGFNPKDMDWLEGKNTAARDISLAFGVPPIMLNIPGDSTFNNYREARMSLYEDTILPLMDFLAFEFNRSITPLFGEGIYLDYDKDSISALDDKRNAKFAQYSSAGFLTTNEKRAALGYDPVDGGDVVLIPTGQTPIDGLNNADAQADDITPENDAAQDEQGEGQDPEADDADTDQDPKHKPHHKQVNAITQRDKTSVWRNVNALRDRMSHSMAADLRDDFDEQASKLEKALENVDPRMAELAAVQVLSDSADMRKTITKHTKRAMKAFGEPILSAGKSFGEEFETKGSVKFDNFVNSYIERHTASAVSHIEGTSIKKARRIIKDVVLSANQSEDGYSSTRVAKQLRDEFASLSASRSETIARTEIGIASSQGAQEAAKALDIPDLEKEWVSVQDDRTRDNPEVADHLSMNGTRVGINEKFIVPPDADMDGPGDPSAGAGQVINCRCVLAFARGGKTIIPNYEVK